MFVVTDTNTACFDKIPNLDGFEGTPPPSLVPWVAQISI